MKNILLALTAGTFLIAATPAELVESPTTTAARYSAIYGNQWPQWIGRLTDPDYLLATYRQKPELAQKYLPLSLVKTGRFAEIVDEVEETPNVDTTDWPTWVGALR